MNWFPTLQDFVYNCLTLLRVAYSGRRERINIDPLLLVNEHAWSTSQLHSCSVFRKDALMTLPVGGSAGLAAARRPAVSKLNLLLSQSTLVLAALGSTKTQYEPFSKLVQVLFEIMLSFAAHKPMRMV